jgi:hypothetical protein
MVGCQNDVYFSLLCIKECEQYNEQVKGIM